MSGPTSNVIPPPPQQSDPRPAVTVQSLIRPLPAWARLVALGAVGLLVLIVISLASGSSGSDQAACTTFWTAMSNGPSYARILTGLNQAAGQAVSQPLKSDLQAAATDFAGQDTIYISDGPTLMGDCGNLGYTDPAYGG